MTPSGQSEKSRMLDICKNTGLEFLKKQSKLLKQNKKEMNAD